MTNAVERCGLFQFQSGSIKSFLMWAGLRVIGGFNSNLVLLKAAERQDELHWQPEFQFQSGSIKSRLRAMLS